MLIFDLFRRPRRPAVIEHSGTPQEIDFDPHGSGRYRQGSGEHPHQHDTSMVGNVRKLKEKGLSAEEIRKTLGLSTTEYRKLNSVSKAMELRETDAKIMKLKEKGLGATAIAVKLYNDPSKESYVRSRLNQKAQDRIEKTNAVVSTLKNEVDKYGVIDIGPGSEAALGIARNRLLTSAKELEEQGYVRNQIYVKQQGVGGNKKTQIQFLAKPGMTMKDVYNMKNDIAVLGGLKGADGDLTTLGIKTPTSVDSSRVLIRYNEEGGLSKDGTIELRRGVPALDMGNAKYAQVRIAVDGTHYLKGMALYKDDIPEGYDIVFNTNKHVGTPMMGPKNNSVLKPIKSDPDNPFGATLRMEEGKIVGQKMYVDTDGKEKLSPINIVREEGDWNNWSKSLASQFLSKQPLTLVKQQLKVTYDDKRSEFDEIMALTNPVVRQNLLTSFADDCYASAVHLKAAALPRQASKVILPIDAMKENEVYAPSFKNGEEVILVRYPHGGTFELPRLTVNNNNKEAKRILGNATDAVGINSSVAGQLSGADFDGDTVVVIPTVNQAIKTQKPLEGLVNFEPKELYKIPDYLSDEEKKKLTIKDTQMEMGKISNLITDMTIQNATHSELERAVKHSMVVIDAEKHGLDYKQSYKDNGIKELQKKYQPKENGRYGGSATIISKAKSPEYVLDRKEVYSSNPKDKETGESLLTPEQQQAYLNGEKVYINTGKLTAHPVEPSDLKKEYGTKNLKAIKGMWFYKDEDGELHDLNRKVEYKEEPARMKSTKMAETKDAMTLVSESRQPVEIEYAKYANSMKALANEARKEALMIKPYEVNKAAKEIYADEIDSINNKILLAQANKPLERKAQAVAGMIIDSKIADNPGMDDDEKKKISTQALYYGRSVTGASKRDSAIRLTDKEWEAIQAGAISSTKLKTILENSDKDYIKKLATPRESKELTQYEINKIKTYGSNGATISEIAARMGVSTSTVSKVLNGKEE